MRKLFWQISTTLDGFMEGPDHELEDTAGFADPDFEAYASKMLQEIDGMLLGRRTYELFVDYWPKAEGPDAERMNALPKYVFSDALLQTDWTNTRFLNGNLIEAVQKMKREATGDLALFGSADLACRLLSFELIDEIRLLVTPVILGAGNPTFSDIVKRIPLRLTQSTAWSSGTLALHYEPIPQIPL